MNGIELSSANLNSHNTLSVYDPDRPRTSTAIAREFQYLRQKMENDGEIVKARKTSRISRGLNPDAPLPPQPPKGTPFFSQDPPKMRRKPIIAGRTKRQTRSRRWISTKSPWTSSAIVSGPASTGVFPTMQPLEEIWRREITSCPRRRRLRVGSSS